jgi:hypothetical protein
MVNMSQQNVVDLVSSGPSFHKFSLYDLDVLELGFLSVVLFFFSSNLSVVLLILPFREFYVCYVSLPPVYFIHVWI